MVDIAASGVEAFDFKSEELKIMHRYRYLLWLMTSIFYLFGDPASHWIFKVGVIALLFISARIAIGVYNKYIGNNEIDKVFIFMETMGIIILLLPTGGVNSPFIWYALNPVLISASLLYYYFCWFNLICYLFASLAISFLLFNPNSEDLGTIIGRYSYLILIFILITLAVQLLSKLSGKLKEQSRKLLDINTQLNQANKQINKSMDHIMSLYQAVELLTFRNNKEGIYNILSEYTVRLTGAKAAFFWLKSSDDNSDTITMVGDVRQDIEADLAHSIRKAYDGDMFSKRVFKIDLDDYSFNAAVVKSTYRDYGIIGFKTNTYESDIIKDEHMRQLEFISEISAVILERFHLEEVTGRLMIAEEQNRIANEMHDSVAQGLFSISYAAHSLIRNRKKMSNSQLEESLSTLQNSASLTMKELRSTIYRLSSKKGGQKSFKLDITEYIDTISKLNNIDIRFVIDGDEEILDVSKKRGLYRIICEATGNAIRHGKCSLIEINLNIDNASIELSISDNGVGFSPDNVDGIEYKGLGLENMQSITKSLGGSINVNSELDNGTHIDILVPNNIVPDVNQGGLRI
ncbi:MAG: sensor histidine kinase [Clostridiales bacterium]|nr:sensor histidine kinase [Clostridiales bacterium]